MAASTTLCLVAGRFGLAPTVGKRASAGLKLAKVETDIMSSDPAGAIKTHMESYAVLTVNVFLSVVDVSLLQMLYCPNNAMVLPDLYRFHHC